MRNDQRTKLAWLSGLTGLGMILLGASMYRRSNALGFAGLGRTRSVGKQAPIVDGYSDGNMKTTLRAKPGEMPIETRIATIQNLIHKSVQDPQMRKVSLAATSQCAERDKVCEARAVYQYIKNRVRYTGDIGPIKQPDGSVEGIDLYQSARRTLEMGGGDCDDQAILGATMLALNGHQPILRIVKTRRAPDWEHIFVGSNIEGRFVPIDTTLPGNRSFGVEPNYHKRIDFPA